MYVRVLRVLPDVATVADRSFNNRVEVNESATLDKRTIDVRVVGVMYNSIRRQPQRAMPIVTVLPVL